MSSDRLIDFGDREFQIWNYMPSHSMLLLRSSKESSGSTRLDVLFIGVIWLNIPVFLNGFVVERASGSEARKIAKSSESILHKTNDIMVVSGVNYRGCIVASGFEVDESDLSYNDIDIWKIGYWVGGLNN